MSLLIILYLTGLILFLIWYCVRQYRRGQAELLSLRNFFLLGFIMWQLVSPILLLITRTAPDGVNILNYNRTGVEFAILATVFIIIFLFVYEMGWVVKRLAVITPMPKVIPSDLGLVGLSVTCTILAIILKFGFLVPFFGDLFARFSEGLSAVAIGLVIITMFRRKLNLAVMIVAAVVLVTDIGISVMWIGSRRPLMGVFLAMIWALYYFIWRGRSITRIMVTACVLSLGPILFMAAFSTIRYAGGTKDDRSLSDHAARIGDADIKAGLLDLVSGANIASCSFWLIETHPEELEYRHLNTLKYFIVYPIPRAIWQDKPTVMALDFAGLAGMRGVPIGQFSVGPGVIGSAACEGGLYALFIYAVWLGLMARYFDELVKLNILSPVAVLIVGAGLGQWLAVPRGETGSFAAIYLFTFIGAYIFSTPLSAIAISFGARSTGPSGAHV